MASPNLVLLTNPPAQDTGPTNNQLLTSQDGNILSLAQSVKILQEYVDAIVSALGLDLTTIQSLLPSSLIPTTASVYYKASGSDFTPNLQNGFVQEFTMTGNTTIHAATGTISPGDQLIIILVQDATGGRTVTWDPTFLFPGIFAPDPDPDTASVYLFMANAKQPPDFFLLAAPIIGITPWP